MLFDVSEVQQLLLRVPDDEWWSSCDLWMLQTWIAMANALLKTVLEGASSSGKEGDYSGSQCSWMVVECRFENAEQLAVLTDF